MKNSKKLEFLTFPDPPSGVNKIQRSVDSIDGKYRVLVTQEDKVLSGEISVSEWFLLDYEAIIQKIEQKLDKIVEK